jgi:hypothetical protein
VASGDSIIDMDGLDVSLTGEPPAADLNRWFSTSDSQPSFPAEPNPNHGLPQQTSQRWIAG